MVDVQQRSFPASSDLHVGSGEAKAVFEALVDYLRRWEYRGYEYDDLLASPLVRFLSMGWLYPSIAAVQVAKRTGSISRRLLACPKLESTKAFGFTLRGFLHYRRHEPTEEFDQDIGSALAWLQKNRSGGYEGDCWGNDFDFASRAGFFPKGLPTVVWSSHIQEAFDMAYEDLEDPVYRDIVVSVGAFVENELGHTSQGTGVYLHYSPGISLPVHNANLLGAVALLRAWKYTGRVETLDLAKRALEWSVSRMNSDGSWYYGPREMSHWIDNYHTGYNLDCLCKANEIAGAEVVDRSVIKETYTYWENNFFLSNGRPKFYHDSVFPTDIQACAQAIESSARYSQYEPSAIVLSSKVLEWTLDGMRKANGAFRYRIYRNRVNNLEPIHWGQATMLSAIGTFLNYKNRGENPNDRNR